MRESGVGGFYSHLRPLVHAKVGRGGTGAAKIVRIMTLVCDNANK